MKRFPDLVGSRYQWIWRLQASESGVHCRACPVVMALLLGVEAQVEAERITLNFVADLEGQLPGEGHAVLDTVAPEGFAGGVRRIVGQLGSGWAVSAAGVRALYLVLAGTAAIATLASLGFQPRLAAILDLR